MATSPLDAVAILNRLAKQLDSRKRDVDLFNKAYDGEFRLAFASEAFQKHFADRYREFSDNWCGVVANAPHERLQTIGIRLDGEDAGDKDLWRTWLDNEADSQSDMAFLDAIIGKRAFGLVWGDRDGNPRITFEHPSQAIVGYDPETRERRAGAKVWSDDEYEYATLYLPDEVWKFQRAATRITDGRTESGLWVIGTSLDGGWYRREGLPEGEPWPMRNPIGKVPLVELPNQPRLMGEPMSDIAGTMAMQNAINLLWGQLFVASDYASFPARVVLGAEQPMIPVLDGDGVEISQKPIDFDEWSVKRAQWIEDPTAKIAEWSAANLEQWTKIIDKAVSHIAAQTRTPPTYFLVGGTIANLGSDAVKNIEIGLVKRTEQKTNAFGRGVRDLFELVALVQDDAGRAQAVRRGEVLWKDIENRSDAQLADALQKKSAIGYPLEYILELDGLGPTEVSRVMDMAREQANDPVLSGALSALTKQAAPAEPSPTEAPPAE